MISIFRARCWASLFAFGVATVPLSGCAQKGPTIAETSKPVTHSVFQTEAAAPNLANSEVAQTSDLRTEIVLRALTLLGVSYRFGGNSPESGLDCSGLVRHVFKEALGAVLPRRSEEISFAAKPIATQDLKPGDLVFFNTLKRAFSHVGIYIGNNQFVHAPSTGGSVRVETLDKAYWSQRFDGARRVPESARKD
jgi:cell wall-associated NlpC family hydrolase